MQRELVILRHAKSDWPEGVEDRRRPLNDRGRRDAPAVGRWLASHVEKVDVAICSPAVRTRQTWELIEQELSESPRALFDDRLYARSAGDIVAVVQELPAEVGRALIIGHNPGLEHTVAYLSGERHTLKTSSIVVLTGKGEWADIAPGWAELAASATPRG